MPPPGEGGWGAQRPVHRSERKNSGFVPLTVQLRQNIVHIVVAVAVFGRIQQSLADVFISFVVGADCIHQLLHGELFVLKHIFADRGQAVDHVDDAAGDDIRRIIEAAATLYTQVPRK